MIDAVFPLGFVGIDETCFERVSSIGVNGWRSISTQVIHPLFFIFMLVVFQELIDGTGINIVLWDVPG